jgi:hypothetical protein
VSRFVGPAKSTLPGAIHQFLLTIRVKPVLLYIIVIGALLCHTFFLLLAFIVLGSQRRVGLAYA